MQILSCVFQEFLFKRLRQFSSDLGKYLDKVYLVQGGFISLGDTLSKKLRRRKCAVIDVSKVGGRVPLMLLLLRLSVFIALIVWVLDKFLYPDHASRIFAAFYGVSGIGNTPIYILGVIQLLLVVGFVMGFKKKITYGAVLLMHAISHLVSIPKFLDPYTAPNLLFFASWPMLAACVTLFYLRDLDTIWTLDKR